MSTAVILGYHVDISEKSAETYARDSLAAPLRSLDEVLERIRAKSFDPDATRSGLLKVAPGTDHEEEVVEEMDSSICPSAVSSSSSLCTEDEVLAGFPAESLPEDESGTLIFNAATMCMHILAGERHLRCGRHMPKTYSTCGEVQEGSGICPMCL